MNKIIITVPKLEEESTLNAIEEIFKGKRDLPFIKENDTKLIFEIKDTITFYYLLAQLEDFFVLLSPISKSANTFKINIKISSYEME